MSIQLKPQDRDLLRRYVDRNRKPTRRQKALALLGLADGDTLEDVSIRVGIKKDDLSGLVARFSTEGLAGIGLPAAGVAKQKDLKRGGSRYKTIVKTPGVCGGEARIIGTRIPVWQLVEAATWAFPRRSSCSTSPHCGP